jgi:hypothetical protein
VLSGGSLKVIPDENGLNLRKLGIVDHERDMGARSRDGLGCHPALARTNQSQSHYKQGISMNIVTFHRDLLRPKVTMGSATSRSTR